MDQFLLDNAQHYAKLVKDFKPAPSKAKPTANADANPDIVIATRLRPMLEDEVASGLVPGVFPRPSTAGVIDLHELRKTVRGTPGLNSSSYLVDRAFSSTDSTETIYQDLVQPLVPWAWKGGVSTMFAYGQTGSGKTFTVSGLECLVAETLFSGLEGHRNIFVSIIELAGNAAFDLLNARKPVSILEDSFGSTHLAGASEYHANDAATLLKHINNAASFRRTASTQKNDSSSRSHAVCKIRIENPALPQSDDGLFYLIDLAGSEAARDVTAHSAERMKEAREINASLSALKDCIRGRASLEFGSSGPKKKTYVPFRQSSLTKVLKHVFDPAAERSCKTVVVACVNPNFADVGASKNTLRYAELLRVQVPKAVAPKYDPTKPSTWSNEQLREWVTKNSGTPEISAEVLAPHETGRQLLRLPVPEFLTRCLNTQGVTNEQATAFQGKFWRLHVDSQNPRSGESNTTANAKVPASGNEEEDAYQGRLSSRDLRPGMAEVTFKERIRSGMVVSWDPPEGTLYRLPGRNLAMVLAPEGNILEGSKSDQTYLCAIVLPAVMPGAFELGVWQQFTVSIDAMEAEVLLEYDIATRYYYETL